jgi:hypothetical protein
VLALKLPDHPLALTVLNFSRREVEEVIDLGRLPGAKEGAWVDFLSGRETKAEGAKLRVRLAGLSGTTFLPAPPQP